MPKLIILVHLFALCAFGDAFEYLDEASCSMQNCWTVGGGIDQVVECVINSVVVL